MITQRPSGQYKVVVKTGDRKISKTFHTLREAERWERRMGRPAN